MPQAQAVQIVIKATVALQQITARVVIAVIANRLMYGSLYSMNTGILTLYLYWREAEPLDMIILLEKMQGLFIEITKRCNARCIYCYNDSDEIESAQIDINAFKCLIDDITQINAGMQITLSGGEPLLHPDLVPMIHYAYQCGHSVLLISNGRLITREFVDQLYPYQPRIQLTLDSHIPELNDKYRSSHSHTHVAEALKTLASFYDMQLVTVRCNLNYENIDLQHGLDYIHYLEAAGVRHIMFSLIQTKGRAFHSLYPNILQDREALVSFVQSIPYCSQIHIDTSFLKICQICPYVTMEKSKGGLTLYIDCAGNLYPCQALIGLPFNMGNIYKSSLQEILQDQKMNNFLLAAKMRLTEIQQCKACDVEMFCGRGCIYDCMMNQGFYGTDGNCTQRKAIIKKSILDNYLKQADKKEVAAYEIANH